MNLLKTHNFSEVTLKNGQKKYLLSILQMFLFEVFIKKNICLVNYK